MISIPKTQLRVYPLCLGGNVFGWSLNEQESHKILDSYFESGGNYIDTADYYVAWAPNNVGGESEKIIGNWISKKQNRNELVIATKVAKLATRKGLSKSNIIAACEDSLRRLKTDYIDIYYAHCEDPNTPQDESMSALDSLIRSGKVRYIGASQHSADALISASNISNEKGLNSFSILQDEYNLMVRDKFEKSQAETIKSLEISLIPYFSLAKGFLTGKYLKDNKVTSVRSKDIVEYETDRGWKVLEELIEISNDRGCSVAAVALAWLRANPLVSTPLASATNQKQLSEIMQLIDLSADEISRLNLASDKTR